MLKQLRNHPLGTPGLLFLLAAVMVLFVLLWGRKRFNHHLSEWNAMQRRIQFSKSGPVTPSAAVLENLQAATARLHKLNAAYDAQLFPRGKGQFGGEFPGDSTAAYFELATFVEEMAQHFRAQGVRLSENPRFGFSQFERQGPEPEILSAVMAQKRAAQALLLPLLEARPLELTHLKREFVAVESKDASLLQPAAGSRSSSRLAFADTIAGAGKRQGFEAYAFELSFEGYTESLRQYLKGLLSATLPVRLTGLKVLALDRFEENPSATVLSPSSNPFDLLSGEASMEDGPVPIIRSNLSSFTLTLEVYCGSEANGT